jgi:hypothetical protein
MYKIIYIAEDGKRYAHYGFNTETLEMIKFLIEHDNEICFIVKLTKSWDTFKKCFCKFCTILR